MLLAFHPARVLPLLFITSLFTGGGAPRAAQSATCPQQTDYQCLPCGSACDKEVVTKPGKCFHCGMKLVPKASVVFQTLAPAAICQYISEHPDAVLLDVRTPEEFDGRQNPELGRLKGAINIPIGELESRFAELNAFRKRPIVVYCSHSHRSPQASYLLTQQGFATVSNLAGGMSVLPESTCRELVRR